MVKTLRVTIALPMLMLLIRCLCGRGYTVVLMLVSNDHAFVLGQPCFWRDLTSKAPQIRRAWPSGMGRDPCYSALASCYVYHLLQEADLALERQKREIEQRKRRLETENKTTLQQTKDGIALLERKLEEYKKVSSRSEYAPKASYITHDHTVQSFDFKTHRTRLSLDLLDML